MVEMVVGVAYRADYGKPAAIARASQLNVGPVGRAVASLQ
jgi:hypothetical protein